MRNENKELIIISQFPDADAVEAWQTSLICNLMDLIVQEGEFFNWQWAKFKSLIWVNFCPKLYILFKVGLKCQLLWLTLKQVILGLFCHQAC